MALQLATLILVVLSVAAASETGAGNKEKRQSPYGIGTLASSPLPSPASVPNTVPASSINSNYIPVCVAPAAAPYYPSAYNADTSYVSQYPAFSAYPAYPSQYPGYQPQYPINPSPNTAYPSPFPAYPSQYPGYPGLYPVYQPAQYPSSSPYSYSYFSGQNNNVGSPLPNSNIPVSTKKK